MNSPLHLTRDRDAYFVIRGYVVQVQHTILRWLRLSAGEVLQLENGEDIDLLAPAVISGTWQSVTLEQIKHREDKVTLRDGSEALANFAEHRRNNSNLNLRFCFTTNSQITHERPYVVPGTPKAGIEIWREIAQGRVQDSTKTLFLSNLKAFLLGCTKPEKLSDNTWQTFMDFLGAATDDQWLDFVQRFEWQTGQPGLDDLKERVKQELVAQGESEIGASEKYDRLFVHIFFLLSRKQQKQLLAFDWLQVAAHRLNDAMSAWLAQFQGEVEALSERVQAIEMRTSEIEARVERQDARLIVQERNVIQIEKSFIETHGLIREAQSESKERLAAIQTEFAKLERTKTAEELLKLPQAQEWRLELEVERLRKWINEGHFKTGSQQIEVLLPEIAGLAAGSARNKIQGTALGILGFCYWRLGELSKAAGFYRRAYTLLPDDQQAQSNAAYAELIDDKVEKALELALHALKQSERNEDALSVAVRALNRLDRDPEISALLTRYPDATSSLQCQFTLGGIALEKHDYVAAQKHAGHIIALQPENPYSLRLLCDALFGEIRYQCLSDPPLLLRFSPAQKQQLLDAENAATDAIEAMREWETQEWVKEALCNRATIRELLGRLDDAVDDCETALRIAPDDPTLLMTYGEILLHRQSNFKKAAEILSRVKTQGRAQEDATILQSEALLGLERWKEAADLLKTIYRPDGAEKGQLDIARLLIDAAFWSKDQELLQSVQNDVETKFGPEPMVLAIQADIARHEGRYEKSVQLMQQVFDLSQGNRRDRAAFLLAQAKALAGDYEGAAADFKKLIDWGDLKADDIALRFYLQSLANAKKFDEAEQVAASIRNGGRAVAGISPFEIYGVRQRGEVNLVLQLLSELSEDEPEDFQHARNLAAFILSPKDETNQFFAPSNLSNDDLEAARAALKRIAFERLKDAPEDLLDVARLRNWAGFSDAVDWAYKAVRSAPNDSKIAGVYSQFILTEVSSDHPRLSKAHVEGECVVTLRRRGQAEEWLLTNNLSGDLHEILLGHAFAQKLQGKKPGDRFRANPEHSWNQDEYEVISVSSKYVHMAQQIWRKFEAGVLNEKWMTVMHAHSVESIDSARGEREQFNEWRSQGKKLAQLYISDSVPIGVIAHAREMMIPAMWNLENQYGGFTITEDGRYFITDGEDERLLKEKQLAQRSKECVLDWTTIIHIVHLNLSTAVSHRYRLLVVRQLWEEAQFYARSCQHQGDALDLLTSAERKRADFAVKLRDFVRDRCEVVELNDWKEVDEERGKCWGATTLATVRLAQQQDVALWADDLNLRRIAQGWFQVEGFCIQPVMDVLLRKQIIDIEELYSSQLRLILAKAGLLWFNVPFVFWILRRDNMAITTEVRLILNNLNLWKTPDDVAVQFTAEMLVVLWLQPMSRSRNIPLVHFVLRNLVNGRSGRDVLKGLNTVLSQRLQNNSLPLKSLQEAINAWARTQIIVSLADL